MSLDRCFGNQCNQEIPTDALWHFCPKCGTRLVTLDWVTSSSDLRTGTQAVALRIRSKVSQQVTVNFRLIPTDGPVQLEKDRETVLVEGEKMLSVPVRVGEGDYVDLEASIKDVIRAVDGHVFEVREGRNQVDRGALSRTTHLYIQKADNERLWASKEIVFAGRRETTVHFYYDGPRRQELIFERPAGWKVNCRRSEFGKDDPCELRIEEATGAEECELTVRAMPSNREIKIRLVPRPTRNFEVKASHLIAIDFGSSRTSIRLIDLQNPNAEPVPLGPEHIPTAIHIRLANDPSTWTFGEAALANAQMKGVLLRDFKRFLWRGDDSEVTSGITAIDALFHYCKFLLEKCVQPEIKELCKTRLADLNYNVALSLPVLSEEEDARYRRVLEETFSRAGFGPLNGFQFMREPDAALSCLYPFIQQSESKLEIGDGVIVVDSGGGTTDVSVGEVVDHGGETVLSIIRHSCVKLTALRDEGKVVDVHFGGEDVTRAYGTVAIDGWLFNYVKAIVQASESGTRSEIRRKGIKRLFREFSEKTPYWTESENDLAVFDRDQPRRSYWDRVAGGLFEQCERLKLRLNRYELDNEVHQKTKRKKQVVFSFSQASSVLPNLEISHDNIDYIQARFGEELRKEISRILDEIRSELDRSGAVLRKICFVGGNCQIASFTTVEQQWNLVPFVTPLNLMQSAVVNGLVSKARISKNFVRSYRVCIGEEPIMTLLKGSVPVAGSKQVDFEPGEGETEIRIEAEHSGEWYCFERVVLPSSYSVIRVFAAFNGSRIEIDAKSSDFGVRSISVEVTA